MAPNPTNPLTDPREGIWAEIVYCPPGEDSSTFVAKIPDDFEATIFSLPDEAFVRFNFVRWLDEDGMPYGKEEDDEVGTDHYFFLRKSTIYCIEPIRGEFVAKWDSTLPDFP